MIIWLASYPKSGNTWRRALLSCYLYSKDGKFDFDLLSKIDSFPSDRVFKNYPDKFEKPEDTTKYWLKEQKKLISLKILLFLKLIMLCVKSMEIDLQIVKILLAQYIL